MGIKSYKDTIEYKVLEDLSDETPGLLKELQENIIISIGSDGELHFGGNDFVLAYFKLFFNYDFRKLFIERAYTCVNSIVKSGSMSPDRLLLGCMTTIHPCLADVFVRVYEDQDQVKIKTPQGLQYYTGIDEIEMLTDKIPDWSKQKQALHTLEECLSRSKHFRYVSAMEKKFREGADLLEVAEIGPEDFDLKSWWFHYRRVFEQGSAIAQAIGLAYDLFMDETPVDAGFLSKYLKAPKKMADKVQNIKDWTFATFKW